MDIPYRQTSALFLKKRILGLRYLYFASFNKLTKHSTMFQVLACGGKNVAKTQSSNLQFLGKTDMTLIIKIQGSK